MADSLSPEERSKNMASIKSKDTKPEITVRKFLYANGFRYRLHKSGLPGKPDIVLSKYKTVIFINGCYWHRHEGCKFAYNPKSNVEFWQEKFRGNVERDKINHEKLLDLGWNIITVWECEVKNSSFKEWLIKRIINEDNE